MMTSIVGDSWIKTSFASMSFFFLIGGFAIGLVRTISWWMTCVSALFLLIRIIVCLFSRKNKAISHPWLILFGLIASGYILLMLDILIG